jgi:hypothetical protein
MRAGVLNPSASAAAVARGYRIEDGEVFWSLVDVLLQADGQAQSGQESLDWEQLGSPDPLGLQGPQALSAASSNG